MRFFEVVLSGAALIAAAWAVELNNVPSEIKPGETYTITYSPKDNTPTTLKLRKGDPDNLDTIATLTTSATGGSFEWTVPDNLPNGDDYAIEIDQEGSDPNYSGLITLTGSDAQPSSSGSASASTSASATATASDSSSTVESTTEASTTVESTTLITTATSASASFSSTMGANSTISSPTLSRTATRSSAPTGSDASSTGSSPPSETGAASMLGSSPLALIFGAIAAMAYLN